MISICESCKNYSLKALRCTLTGVEDIDVKSCMYFDELDYSSEVKEDTKEEIIELGSSDLSHLKDDPNEIKILMSNYDMNKTAMFDCKSYMDKYDSSNFENELDIVLDDIHDFLMEKNKAYGDSALNPIRAFSKADSIEQIKVRIDDKISRLIRGKEYIGDNDEKDLLGYLVLLQIARKRKDNEEEK